MAIVALVWRICEWHLRQARIKVMIAEAILGPPLLKEAFVVEIKNYGKESIKINSVGFKCTERQNLFLNFPETKGVFWLNNERPPYELKGNDSYSVWVRKDVLSSCPVEIPLVAWCRDALDNVYYSKKYKIILSR